MEEFEPEEQPEFNIPDSLLNKLYELSGDSDKYKGLIFACANESGSPSIFTRFDSVITELGLRKAMLDYLEGTDRYNEMIDK